MRVGSRAWVQPLCVAALLLATALALTATAATDQRDRADEGPRLEDDDPAALAELGIDLVPQIAPRVAELRGLSFDELPVPRIVDTAYLNDLLTDEYRRRIGDPEETLAADQAAARILGMLDAGDDLTGLVENSGEAAAAAWDPRSDSLYVISDAVGDSAELLELYLSHELTHALEDQRYGLPEPESLNDDRVLAQSALVEGTATTLMIEYAERHIDPLALSAASLGLDPGTGELPEYAVELLEWTYLGGARFVEELYRRGGGWDLIDHAIGDRLPASTEQVLHPLKYVRGERPLPVTIEPGPLPAGGWERDDAATLGELATRQLIALGAPEQARQAAAGWGGDRYELWKRDTEPLDCEHPCREELALVLRWRWDTAADAEQFAAAARRYVEDGIDGARTAPDVWEAEGGWVTLGAEPRRTTLAFAPSEGLALAVATGG